KSLEHAVAGQQNDVTLLQRPGLQVAVDLVQLANADETSERFALQLLLGFRWGNLPAGQRFIESIGKYMVPTRGPRQTVAHMKDGAVTHGYEVQRKIPHDSGNQSRTDAFAQPHARRRLYDSLIGFARAALQGLWDTFGGSF